MRIKPEQVCVFVGAGASVSMPSGLPSFDSMRNQILHQLYLDRFTGHPGRTAASGAGGPAVAAGLAAEPFMLALSRAGVQVEDWLAAVLTSAEPNAAHYAIAKLAVAGARVWTVNFDTLIETAAGGRLASVAWPDDPRFGSSLMKPHGTVGGQLIVTAEQVLSPMADGWRERLAADMAGKTVVLLGYKGRDLDLQPIWDEVLEGASEILWFDRWEGGRPVDELRKRSLLRRASERGVLSFPPHEPPPPGVRAGSPNPSWDFVAWCQGNGLAEIEHGISGQLFDQPRDFAWPALRGRLAWARPAVQGLLGDYPGEQASYVSLAVRSSNRREALGALASSAVNHGGNQIAAMMAPVTLLPPIGLARNLKIAVRRKRLSIWARTGRHGAVLRATRQPSTGSVSTELILRSASLRITGSLDEAVETAATALRIAISEQHPVRVAHAAFQQCIALLWAERLPEARLCLADQLEPYATIAASRWVAWADFIAAGLAVRDAAARDRDNSDALKMYARSEQRFRAEALLDGAVSVMTGRLAAYRLACDDVGFERELGRICEVRSGGGERGRYYTRHAPFTDGSIDVERAEFARVHRRDLDAARRLYLRVARSRYPLQQALGHLGVALIDAERGEEPRCAADAARVASSIGFRLVSQRAGELLASPDANSLREVLFC